MIIANTNKHVIPYWNEGVNLKLGLNQLGIRNVAEQMFAKLLPGLNNVSSRIRYYSFYCWLVNQFYDGKESIVDKDFYPYLRRAELLVALINATKEDSLGIPGITYALNQIQKGEEKISLKNGAAFGNGTYWANPGGIFRQYYGASLEEIGLIGTNNQSSQLYNVCKDDGFINGKKLADIFSKSVGEDGEKFIGMLYKDDVSIDELRSLNDTFNMKLLPNDSQERELLQNMLLQIDGPVNSNLSFHRRNTIKYVLRYLSKANTPLTAIDFSGHMYEEFHRGERDLTTWGWYAYFLDDNWQFQLTSIFNYVLSILKEEKDFWTPIEVLSTKISNEVIEEFNVNKSTLLRSVIASCLQEKKGRKVTNAINNLLWYYKMDVDFMGKSEQHYHDIGVEVENFCDFMGRVKQSLDSPFYDYVRRLLVEDVIFRHYRVSFRKMLQTGLATQKFSIENGNIRFIEDWPTSHTSPRIDTLRDFMIDLRLINKDGNLTELGVELFKRMNDESNR